ncbi:RNA polymerase II-associated protein 3 [Borealophlyctis nickersoniae]|nr:RNA polymerase II-associated protein 3 [Borealophlyctis nickersoniae]
MDPLHTPYQIRQNAQEYNDFLRDLSSWEKDIKQKDKAAKTKPWRQTDLPPIRSKGGDLPATASAARGTTGSTAEQKEPVQKIKAYDYRSWDKFDVDKALEEIEGQPAKEPTPDSVDTVGGMVTDPDVDRIEKSLIEKEKGNAFFRKGDYKRAAACYGKSMKFDPTNAVLPVNRAMAHLKLFNYVEAESDCTTGLALDPKNVKALWRRGIARRELGKLDEAKGDLELAGVLEPANKSMKEDLNKVYELLRNKAEEEAKGKPLLKEIQTKKPSTSKPIRRRLEIEEIGEDVEAVKGELLKRKEQRPSAITEVTSKNIVQPSLEPPSVSANPGKSASVKALPVKRVIEMIETPPPTSPKPAVGPSPALPPRVPSADLRPSFRPTSPMGGRKRTPPKTMFEFERDWRSMKGEVSAVYEYMKVGVTSYRIQRRTGMVIFTQFWGFGEKVIPPTTYPTIFKNSMEAQHLTKMSQVLLDRYIANKEYAAAFHVLANLATVQRFDMALMFLSKKERSEIISHLRTASSVAGYNEKDVERLARMYKVQ